MYACNVSLYVVLYMLDMYHRFVAAQITPTAPAWLTPSVHTSTNRDIRTGASVRVRQPNGMPTGMQSDAAVSILLGLSLHSNYLYCLR